MDGSSRGDGGGTCFAQWDKQISQAVMSRTRRPGCNSLCSKIIALQLPTLPFRPEPDYGSTYSMPGYSCSCYRQCNRSAHTFAKSFTAYLGLTKVLLRLPKQPACAWFRSYRPHTCMQAARLIFSRPWPNRTAAAANSPVAAAHAACMPLHGRHASAMYAVRGASCLSDRKAQLLVRSSSSCGRRRRHIHACKSIAKCQTAKGRLEIAICAASLQQNVPFVQPVPTSKASLIVGSSKGL